MERFMCNIKHFTKTLLTLYIYQSKAVTIISKFHLPVHSTTMFHMKSVME